MSQAYPWEACAGYQVLSKGIGLIKQPAETQVNPGALHWTYLPAWSGRFIRPVAGACSYFFFAIGALTVCLNVVLGCFFANVDETNLPVSEER